MLGAASGPMVSLSILSILFKETKKEGIMNSYFIVSGSVSLLLACVHYFFGTPRVVKPINEVDGLNVRIKFLAHGTWQAVTVMLLAMAGAMFWAATHADSTALAVFVCLQAVALTIMGLVLIMPTDIRILHMPQVFGFVTVAGTAALGLMA